MAEGIEVLVLLDVGGLKDKEKFAQIYLKDNIADQQISLFD